MIMKNGTTQSYRGNNGGVVIQPPSSVDAYSHCGNNYATQDDDDRHGVRRSTRPFASAASSSSSSIRLVMSSRDLYADEEEVTVDNDTGDLFPIPQPQATALTATIMASCVRAILVLLLTTTTGAVGILNTPLPAMAATPPLVVPSAPAPPSTTITTKVPIEAPTGVSSSSVSVAAAAESVSSSGLTVASSAAEAARLLLETPATQMRLPTNVRHQILEQLQHQDARLADCEGRNDDTWEQCFYYGNQGGGSSTQENNDAPFIAPLPPAMLTPDRVGSRIPTW